jgi:hypothetical protein
VAELKELEEIDGRIVDFYVTTSENTNNKDVLYYAAFNFPAFVYAFGPQNWH